METKPKRVIVGLTGQSGAGKSLFAAAARERGFLTVDCDTVAHEVTAGGEALTALTREFGDRILAADGTLDRRALAAAAFSSPAATERLNGTALPFIAAEVRRIIARHEGENILLDAPTLYESGLDAECNAVVAVLAAEDVRLERVTARDGISREAALRRFAAGKPDEFYHARADYVLCNNSTPADFLGRAAEVVEEILKKQG